jgi:hypothetical protein
LEPCPSPRLRLLEGATGDFAEVRVHCVCGQSRPLIDASPETRSRCLGRRPWLGPEGDEPCTESSTRLLVRSASNAYFSQVESALSIPDQQHRVREAVQSVWDVVQVADATMLPHLMNVPKVRAALGDFDPSEVLEAIAAERSKSPVEREPLRTAEFKLFIGARDEAPGDLSDPKDTFFARRARTAKIRGIERVVLAHKLREVRAEIGFTRLESATPDLQGEFDLQVTSSPLGLQTDWLPASEVFGEGVFIQLDEAAVREWEKSDAVKTRGRELHGGYQKWATSAGAHAPPFPGVRFYLLHSLSHLLISAMSLECGYAASAIRERIYCSVPGDPTPMAGILLSTGSPGTEGTLGGLVDEGRRLRDHLRYAFELGALCSNDPVCAAHDPSEDVVERYLEGCACHGCLFIAECSCERFNRYLDRALVVPTLGRDGALPFFKVRP